MNQEVVEEQLRFIANLLRGVTEGSVSSASYAHHGATNRQEPS
jgi:hypothetical protein